MMRQPSSSTRPLLILFVFMLAAWASMVLDPANLGRGKGGWNGLFQADSEALVLGGIAADMQSGVPLAAALCKTKGWTHENAHTYPTLFIDTPCEWDYMGNMGVQRLVWTPVVMAANALDTAPMAIFVALKILAGLATAVAMAIVVYGVTRTWGSWGGVATGTLFLTANQWVMVGPNLYWMGAFWLAPPAWLLWKAADQRGFTPWIATGLGLTLIVKMLAGLEGAPALLAMVCVLSLALWGWKAAMYTTLTGSIALVAVVGLHLAWAAHILGGWGHAWADMVVRVMKRTVGHPDATNPVIVDSLESPVWVELYKHLLLYPTHAHMAAALVAMPPLLILVFHHKAPGWSHTMGLLVGFWAAALAWPIIAAPHTYIHGSLLSFLTLYATIPTYVAAAYLSEHRWRRPAADTDLANKNT